MKWYIAYKFTGEDKDVLKDTMSSLIHFLENESNEVYCSLFDEGMVNIGNKKVFEKAFDKINNSNAILIFLNSDERSEGMLMEIGYALAKGKRVILAIKKDLGRTHLRDLIDEIIEFEDIEELKEKLKKL